MSLRELNNRQFLLLAVGLAVLLRLLLMPFFAHVDLFSEYRRVHYAIDNHLFFAHTHRIVTFYIEMVFVGLSKLFIPASETAFFLPDPSKSTASLQDYYLFLQDPHIYRYLFFFKLPYLVFDLGVAGLIWRFIDQVQARRLALLLWLFNPLTLYATYVFGRFEVIAIFFLALTALNLKQHRLILACISFAVVLLCREIYLLLLPFFLLALIDFKDHWVRNAIALLLATALIFGLYRLPDWIIPLLGSADPFVDPDANHQLANKLFSLGYYWFYPIVFGLASAAIYAWEIGSRSSAERFILSGALALLVYFAFNVHSVHYASWLVLLPILSMQFGKKVVLPFLALFAVWVILWLLKTDAGVFTPFLAAPLSFEFVGIGHFPSWFNQHLATDEITLLRAVQIMRTLFAVVMAFFCIRLVSKSQN